jgi:predicted O-methyltransferase YrrM
MEMTPARWRATRSYLTEVFGAEDEVLRGLRAEAEAAGLPPIAISAELGRLLGVLASLAGARRAVEVGTLGGYSAIWIARGLAPGGRLVTIEREAPHADFAERQLARAGLADRVEVRRGDSGPVLAALAAEWAPASVDLVFLDADKRRYAADLDALRPLLAPGALVLADNVLGTGSWWIDDETHPDRQAVDAFSRALAADPDFEVTAVSAREGLLIARHLGRARLT